MVAAAILGSAAIGGVSSMVAGSQQADANREAAGLQAENADKASAAQVEAARLSAEASLNASRESNAMLSHQFDVTQANQQPWLTAGAQALGTQSAGLTAGGEFNKPFTAADMINDPGYNFRLQQGTDAVQGSAAARGGLLSGGTLKALTQYGQDYGSNEFQNAYNRYQSDVTSRFNRLASVAGTGQTAANSLSSSGNNLASNMASNTMTAGQAQASSYTNAGNAQAAGYTNAGNAIAGGIIGASNANIAGMMGASNAIGNGVNGYLQYNTLQNMIGRGSGTLAPISASTPSWIAP